MLQILEAVWSVAYMQQALWQQIWGHLVNIYMLIVPKYNARTLG